MFDLTSAGRVKQLFCLQILSTEEHLLLPKVPIMREINCFDISTNKDQDVENLLTMDF